MKPGYRAGESVFLIFFLLISGLRAAGQAPENLSVEHQKEIIRKIYSGRIEAPKEVINGKEYIPYYRSSIFKPLLFAGKERSSVLFAGARQYRDLSLQYDTYLDEVIFTDTSAMINFVYPQIALNKDIVKGFNLYFPEDSMIFRYTRNEPGMKEGFYEAAYENGSRLFIRHRSSYYEKDGIVNYKYFRENYISTGKNFMMIRNKKDLLKLLGGSKQIKEYIHSSKIRVRKADKKQLTAVLKIYDSLKTLK
jgi:hypothetical protein